MRSCEDCIHYSMVVRYDMRDKERAYDLARCDLTGEETDDPNPCDEWAGDVDSMQAHIDGLQDELHEMEDACSQLRALLKTERNNFRQATDARAMWQERYEKAARECGALQSKLAVYDETHILLPLDMDGTPIRLHDKMEAEDGMAFPAKSIHFTSESWGCDSWWVNEARFDPKELRHYHEPTVEDVLQKMLEQAVGYSEAHTTVALSTIAEYADKLRELMEVDA